MPHINTYTITGRIVIALGIFLSLFQFFYGRSLWLDEAMLALNILDRSPLGLMHPLAHHQVAPPLFLLLEKAASYIPCQTDYALRLIPLFSYWAMLYFFTKLSHSLIKAPSARFAALSLISLSTFIIYFSNEIKQYMTDAVVTCVLCYAYLQPKQLASRYYGTLIIAGGIALFLSNAAIILLFSIGVAMLWHSDWKRPEKWIILTGGVWLVAFMLYYSFFIAGHPSKAFMLSYWEEQHAFMPLNPFSEQWIRFVFKQSATITSMYIPKLPWISRTLLPILFIAGILYLFRRFAPSPIFLLLLLPIPVHLGISALKLYPFEARLYLYLLPLFALIMGLGWEKIVSHFPSRLHHKLEKSILILPFFLLAGIHQHGFPMQRQEHKENLAYYNLHSKTGQGLFISAGSRHVGKYYSLTQFIQVKGPLVLSKTRKNRLKESRLDEILSLKGQQWLLFTTDYKDRVDDYIRTLDSLRIPKLESHKAKNSLLVLYDFGNGQKK